MQREYKAEEVGIQACQSSTAVHNVQGAGHVDDEDDGGDHPQDVFIMEILNILKSFIGTVNCETR